MYFILYFRLSSHPSIIEGRWIITLSCLRCNMYFHIFYKLCQRGLSLAYTVNDRSHGNCFLLFHSYCPFTLPFPVQVPEYLSCWFAKLALCYLGIVQHSLVLKYKARDLCLHWICFQRTHRTYSYSRQWVNISRKQKMHWIKITYPTFKAKPSSLRSAENWAYHKVSKFQN